MTSTLVILYIGLAIMNAVAIAKNNPDAEEAKDIDRTKGFLKPYTLTMLATVIAILFFIKGNAIMGCFSIINALLDLRAKA
jgi:hypothetical protein